MSQKTERKALALLAAGFLLLLIWSPLYLAMRLQLWGLERTASVQAIVIEDRSGGGEGGSTLYCPVLRYVGMNGDLVEKKFSPCSIDSQYVIGDRVGLLLDPKHTDNVQINSFYALWFFPLLYLLVAGAAWLVFIKFNANLAVDESKALNE